MASNTGPRSAGERAVALSISRVAIWGQRLVALGCELRSKCSYGLRQITLRVVGYRPRLPPGENLLPHGLPAQMRDCRGNIAPLALHHYGRASRIMLKGVSVARLTPRMPPAVMTSRSLVSPACAPRAAPTSCDSEVGIHTIVEAA